MNITRKLIEDLKGCNLPDNEKEDLLSIVRYVVTIKEHEGVIIIPDKDTDGSVEFLDKTNELITKMWSTGHALARTKRNTPAHIYTDCTIRFSAEERETLDKALAVYWRYLTNRFRKEIEERLRKTCQAIGKAQKEGKFDSTEVPE